MIGVLGLALLGLTLYVSTLVYTIRTFSRSKLAALLTNGHRERWLTWLDRVDWELQTVLGLFRLSLHLGMLGFVLHLFVAHLSRETSFWLGVESGAVTLLVLAIFSIAVPHALAVHAGERILAASLHLLMVMRWIFWPMGRVFDGVEFVVRRLLGKADFNDEEESERVEQEILDAVSEGEAYGAVDEEKKEMIESVFELDETPVTAIMTPRTDIHALPANATYDDVRAMILSTGHSRIPVYEGTIDHIVGVVYAKDLLRLNSDEPFDVRTVMRTAPYVPETKTIDALLDEFRATRVQIAIVLDEYGGTAGLCTIEDILEELVGEIDDEYDQSPPPAMNRLDETTLEVDARVHISEINAELDIELPEEEDYETIGGFVFATLGKIPAAGEEFVHGNIHVQIVEAEPRRIKRLRLHVQRERAQAS
ncbi:MAG: HlyC/CorC family transporter [Phycisphaerales bacterium]|nr:HlyC/CorC family transporter [Phycisphaerales bacterium]